MTTSADEPVTEHDDSSDTGAGGVGVGEVVEVDGADAAEFGGADIAGTDVEVEAAVVAEVSEDSGADAEPAPMSARIPPARTVSGATPDLSAAAADDADADDDAESGSTPGRFVSNRRGRGGYDPEADAVARATRYRYRQRMTLALALSALLFGGFALAVSPLLWWGCGLCGAVLAGYLIYLRRQVRFEEEIRRRRSSRLSGGGRPAAARDGARSGGKDSGRDEARDLRRRAVVMDIDDEDPGFDFLENFDAAAARATRARAAGGEIARAAGE
nr:gephyrin-like molybdotransferase receptor GlpR [Nocardia macrotermitis]